MPIKGDCKRTVCLPEQALGTALASFSQWALRINVLNLTIECFEKKIDRLIGASTNGDFTVTHSW